MINTIVLDSEQYETFLNLLTSMKDICNDIDIQEGIIRQRSNDKNALFELDFSTILPSMSFVLIDLKKKLDLLKIFVGQDNITIKSYKDEPDIQNYFEFSDNYTRITFKEPSSDFIDNKFVTEQESSTTFAHNEADLLLQTNLSMLITNRVKIITTSFNTPAIQIFFDGEEASLRARTQSKDQTANILTNIQTNIMLEKCFVNITAIPFTIEHDSDMEMSMYQEPNNISMNILKTSCGTVDIVIYTKSVIISEDEVEE
jgi:hypothetical protein